MTEKYKELPLYSESSYKYSVSVDNTTLRLSFDYNSKSDSWYMSVSYEDAAYVVEGIRLIPNFPILKDYSIEGLSGFFLLLPRTNVDSSTEIDQRFLPQYYQLFYVY